ncbi:UTRA domain-containing protein [Corynebacterium casei]|uniref:UTRA domain-containing protein n=1 Tax=Corynebacterium casei TaxID=160386 RepID=UPI003FCF6BC1
MIRKVLRWSPHSFIRAITDSYRYTTLADTTEHDLNPTSKILWMARRPAPAHVAAALGMKPDDPIIFISRVLFAESRPLILERQYFPLEVGMHVLAMEPDTDDIHEELIREGINFDSCRRSIEFVQADEEMARLL